MAIKNTVPSKLSPIERVHLLTNFLIAERKGEDFLTPDKEFEESFETFRALVNLRDPNPIPQGFIDEQDIMLQSLLRMEGVTRASDIEPVPSDPHLKLWAGDITTLEVDGIVNAASPRLLGCFQPGHYCIDNAIHTFAGIQLRLECNEIMMNRGAEEEPGKAIVTDAYNLPSTYVIHTVPPIAGGKPVPQQRKELTDCYLSSLNAAAYHDMRSIAFTFLGAGIDGFPQREAAQIAVDTVKAWFASHPTADMTVIFVVYTEEDFALYQNILR